MRNAVNPEAKTNVIAEYVGAILTELELDGDNEHFAGTPMRVARMLQTFTQYSEEDLRDILATGFEETDDNILVVQTRIPFVGMCAHHLLPFTGSASVGYIPRKRVVGLSKLTRLVRAAGRVEPSTQEHITNLIADTLHRTLEPVAAGAVTTATHGCMSTRGVLAHETQTKVSALRGQFLLNTDARKEFLDMAMEGIKNG
jgi:GTP cyclohydrolase I